MQVAQGWLLRTGWLEAAVHPHHQSGLHLTPKLEPEVLEPHGLEPHADLEQHDRVIL